MFLFRQFQLKILSNFPNRMLIHQAKMHALNNKGRWIQDVVESPKFHKGAFTKKAKAAGYKTTNFMRHVLDNPEDFDPTTVRQARFMKTLVSFQK